MGIWLEFRCENRENPSAEGIGLNIGDRCYSHDNFGPSDLAGDTVASVLELLQELGAEGRKDGWKKTREGWTCPFCVKAMKVRALAK